jgi:hypothetical protein
MGTFTTQITDANIVSELPDVSILGSLYDDATTSAELVATFASVSFRKKFQTLLKFKMSDTSRDSLIAALRQSYIDYETANGKTVTESGGNIFVNDRLVALDIDGFADGLFVDQTFADAFFVPDVMDAIFGSGDEAFIDDIVNVGNFWNKLLSYSDAIAHMEATYPEVVTKATEESEYAYVKYVTYKAGLDFEKYKSIEYLAEDSAAMDTISIVQESKVVERASKFGIMSRLMYVFAQTDINDIAESQDNIDELNNDPQLRAIVVDFDSLSILPADSLMRKYILDNDGRFGAIVSERLNIETTVTMSNLFYDESFSDEKDAFVRDEKLVSYLFESALYPNFRDSFYEAFTRINSTGQEWSFKVNQATNTLVAHTVDTTFAAKKLSLSLDSFTQTKLGSVSDAAGLDTTLFVPYTFVDETVLAVNLSHEAVFTNADNYNLYNEFVDRKFETVVGANGHIMGITADGDVVSSKFLSSLNLSTEDIENIMITEDNIFIKTQQTFHAIGNLGEDKNDIVNNLIVNKDDIQKAVFFAGNVLGLGTDGAIKIIAAGGLSNYSATDGIVVTDMSVIDGRLVILDDAGVLSEVKTDGSTLSISTDVADMVYSQDAIVCTISGTKLAVFNSGSQWLIYDYKVNQI